MIRLYIIAGMVLMLTGCADSVSFVEAATMEPVGFLHGVWHGITVIISFIGSIFFDDIAVYAIYNNGGWYDLGYIIGIVTLILSIDVE